jgi:hypothetical protein
MNKENHLHLESTHSFEEAVDFCINKTDAADFLGITIAQEQSVDSYNYIFDNSITLTRAQAVQLRDWLISATDERLTAIRVSASAEKKRWRDERKRRALFLSFVVHHSSKRIIHQGLVYLYMGIRLAGRDCMVRDAAWEGMTKMNYVCIPVWFGWLCEAAFVLNAIGWAAMSLSSFRIHRRIRAMKVGEK